jgi:hypothetical protein
MTMDGFNMESGSYQTLDGITADRGGGHTGNPVGYIWNSDHATLRNSEIANVTDDFLLLTDGTTTTYLTLDHNYFHGITHDTVNYPAAHNECAYVNGGDHITISRNLWWNCGTTGDLTLTASNSLVETPTDVLVENNVFGPSYNAYSVQEGGCCGPQGRITYRNNLFLYPPLFNQIPTSLVMNDNIGVKTGCETGATFSHNIWTAASCGATDVKNSNILSSTYYVNPGSSARGSTPGDWHYAPGNPAIGTADPSSYAPVTRDGCTRDSAPDAGAYEYGSSC